MEREQKTDHHLPSGVYLRSGSYYLADSHANWVWLGGDYPTAMAKYEQLVGDLGCVVTVGDLIDRYLREVAPLKAQATYKGNIVQAKYLRIGLGEIRVEDLGARQISRYMDIRGERGKAQTSRELAMLSHMLKHAIRWGVIDQNPCRDVMRFKEKPRRRYIRDAEYKAFHDFAGPLIAAYMDFKLLTGLRKADILLLRCDALKADGIHVEISKTRKKIIISWTDHLEAAVQQIKSLPRPVNSMFLFSTRRGQPYAASGFASIWQRKMVRALEQGVLQKRFTDHDLRTKTGSDAEV